MGAVAHRQQISTPISTQEQPAGAQSAPDWGNAETWAQMSGQPGLLPACPTPLLSAAAESQSPPSSPEVAQAKGLLATIDRAVTSTKPLMGTYVAARDALDGAAVAEVGTLLAACEDLLQTTSQQLFSLFYSVRSSWSLLDEELEALMDDEETVKAKVRRTRDEIAGTIAPHTFAGAELAGGSGLGSVSNLLGSQAMLAEVGRTVGMMQFAQQARAKLAEPEGRSEASLSALRTELQTWARRPMNLAFIAAALGPQWALLDPPDPGKGTLLGQARLQAEQTGWLGTVGKLDMTTLSSLAVGRDRVTSEQALQMLYAETPESRATLLEALARKGQLDPLLEPFGWAFVKEVHDSLPQGHGELKTQLQKHFIGDDKHLWGPALDREWDSHRISAWSLFEDLGPVGWVVNHGLDAFTGGYYKGHSDVVDGYNTGMLTESQARAMDEEVGNRAAIALAVSFATAGTVDKLVRGGMVATQVAGATGAAKVGGLVGGTSAVAGLAASDLYNVSQGKDGSPLLDYAKVAALGAGGGAGLGALSFQLSERAQRYVPGTQAPGPGVATGPAPAQAAPQPAPRPAAPVVQPRPRAYTREHASELIRRSEGRQGPGTNVGHAEDHVPYDGADPAQLSLARPNNGITTTFRSDRHAEQALRDVMEANRARIEALPADGTTSVGDAYTLREPVLGYRSMRADYVTLRPPPTELSIERVTWRIARLPNGELHLVHFAPAR